MIQFLLAAAPAFLQAGQAAFGASQENQAAKAQQDAQKAQAEAQIKLNQMAANREWDGAQRNYNSKVEAAAMQHVEILKKRVRAEGSYSAEEGRSGKTAKRRKTIQATGAAGFDMNALNRSTQSAKEATLHKMEQTAIDTDLANQRAANMVKPIMQKSVLGAAVGSLAMSAATAGIGALKGKFANPMGKAKDAAGAADYAGGAAENVGFTEKLGGLGSFTDEFKFDTGMEVGMSDPMFAGNLMGAYSGSLPIGILETLKIRR